MNDKYERIDRYGNVVYAFRHRLAMCNRGTDGGPVQIKRSPDALRAQYFGLQTCGNPWICPVCSSKIAADNVRNINRAMATWVLRAVGRNRNYLLTYTAQHTAETAGQGMCKASLDQLAEALSKFKGKRVYRETMQSIESVGLIRGLETTYGEMNGWHHHTHEILFANDSAMVLDRAGRVVRWLSPVYKLRRAWARELIKRGMAGIEPGDIGIERRRKLRALLTHCFDAKDGSYCGEYVAKLGREPESDRGRWGLGSELAKTHLKTRAHDRGTPQRCDHASIMGLLNDYLDGDERSGELYREAGLAFARRARVFWSKGLKALLDITEETDEEIAAKPDERCTEHVIEIHPRLWGVILARDARFEVLRIAAIEGRAGVVRLLDELERSPPTHSAEFTESRSYFMPVKVAA